MAKKPVNYCVVDAFTDSAFKGNPAAVCFLEEERDDQWLQSVATEFNLSETCYLTRITDPDSDSIDSTIESSIPRFRLRWFTPVTEVKLCGHATLAASHFLFRSSLVNSNTIEYSTLSGILTAKRVPDTKSTESSVYQNDEAQDGFLIELDFPAVPLAEYNDEVSVFSKALNGNSVVEIKKIATGAGDILVELLSGNTVEDFQPQIDEIQRSPASGILITGLAPPGSGFDFFSRYFCPKFGINEDPVTGSAHCALAPYWSKKLGKFDFVAYQASPRGGIINLHLDEKNQRVLLRGKAIAVMEGSLLV